MSFDRDQLARAIAEHGVVARVVVARIDGSTPREAGAAMLVWPEGQSGTIGGGTLEFQAAANARSALAVARDRLDRMPLGPALGQCCGGAVTLLTEVWDAARLETMTGEIMARPLPGKSAGTDENPAAPPLSVRRALAEARGAGTQTSAQIRDGWMIEPLLRPKHALWIYGAGHVGRAIVDVIAPMPAFEITWVDTGADRFPDTIPDRVTPLVAAHPQDVLRYAPRDADHLILTYSHAIDLDLCHALIGHGFRSAGLIGSKTKWARFRSRLAALGHRDAQISRITCPIGDPALGKHPQAIAVGVAAGLLMAQGMGAATRDARRTAS